MTHLLTRPPAAVKPPRSTTTHIPPLGLHSTSLNRHDVIMHLLESPVATTIVDDGASRFVHTQGRQFGLTTIEEPCIYSIYTNKQIDKVQAQNIEEICIRFGLIISPNGYPLFLLMVQLHPDLPKMEVFLSVHDRLHLNLLLALALGETYHLVIVSKTSPKDKAKITPVVRIQTAVRFADSTSEMVSNLLTQHIHSKAPRHFDHERHAIISEYTTGELWARLAAARDGQIIERTEVIGEKTNV